MYLLSRTKELSVVWTDILQLAALAVLLGLNDKFQPNNDNYHYIMIKLYIIMGFNLFLFETTTFHTIISRPSFTGLESYILSRER